MKKKYYMRGLGLGILITALVFMITGSKEMTDAEIISRAMELGYVKAETEATPTIDLDGLKEKEDNKKVTPKPTVTVTPTEAPTPTESPSEAPTEVPTPTTVPTPTPVPTATPTATPTPEPTKAPTPTVTSAPSVTPEPTNVPEQEDTEVVTADIAVERGNTAAVVCRKMEEAGIIEDGNEFKNYLIRRNLTDYINIGVYRMSGNMSYEELAKILTGR